MCTKVRYDFVDNRGLYTRVRYDFVDSKGLSTRVRCDHVESKGLYTRVRCDRVDSKGLSTSFYSKINFNCMVNTLRKFSKGFRWLFSVFLNENSDETFLGIIEQCA